jgi:hypothetical protein
MREALVAIDRPSELVLVRVASTPTRAFHLCRTADRGVAFAQKNPFFQLG